MKSLESVNSVQRFAENDQNFGMSPNNPDGISNGSRSRIAGGQ